MFATFPTENRHIFFSNLIKKTYNMPRSTNNAALKKSGIGMSINQTIHPLDSGRYSQKMESDSSWKSVQNL